MCKVIKLALLGWLISFLSLKAALAGPAAPLVYPLTHADGTTFMARTFGDERLNGVETAEEFTILFDKASRNWVYAQKGVDGALIKSTWVVGRDSPTGIGKHLRPSPAATQSHVAPRSYTPPIWGAPFPNRDMPSPALAPAPNTGIQPVLVILVQFLNLASVGSSASDWANKFFGPTNSVKHYYNEVSYGKLILNPTSESHGNANDGIVGWLTLNYSHPNTGGDTDDRNRQLTKDALIAADSYVNYASFDTNGDGFISSWELHIVIVAAGYEMAFSGPAGACGPGVWAHQWSLGGSVPAPVLDGKTVGSFIGGGGYTQLGEWHCISSNSPGHMATIGVMCHELGHDLSLPDLYDTDGSSEGIGEWGLMGGGGWNSTSLPGDSPAHMCAWSKYFEGWISPTKVTGTLPNEPIDHAESNPDVYQFLNGNPSSGTGEYFLIENRQKVGYDAGIPSSGLFIWHIDESRANNDNEWYPGCLFCVSHYKVALVQADNLWELEKGIDSGDGGDPFPGSSNKINFDDTSAPNSKLYSGSPTGISITNISPSGPTMTATLSHTTTTTTVPGTPSPLSDPVGDTYETSASAGLTIPDITSMSAVIEASNLVFTVSFVNNVAPVTSQGPNVVVGLIDIDVDQNGATGMISGLDIFGPPGHPPSNLGVEYYAFLSDIDPVNNTVGVFGSNGNKVGNAPLVFNNNVMTVTIPLTLLGNDDGIVNFGSVLGTLPEPTDIIPNEGFGISVASTPGSISGKVIKEDDGSPLAGIGIWVADFATDKPLFSTSTDSSGNYTISLPPGSYRVSAYPPADNLVFLPEFFDNTTDFFKAAKIIVKAGQDTSNINFALRGGVGTISGKVIREDNGAPIQGILIFARDFVTGELIGDVFTDTNGNFKIPLLPGSYRVTATDLNFTYLSEFFDNAIDFTQAQQVNVIVGQNTPNINFSLRLGASSISGRVIREDNGVAIPGILVFAKEFSTGHILGSATTEGAGYYTIAIPAGSYKVVANPSYTSFTDPAFREEYFNNTSDPGQATKVNTVAGGKTSGINFSLSVSGPLVTLAIGNGAGAPGAKGVLVSINLTSSSEAKPASLQIDIGYDFAVVTATGATAGQAATNAGKDVSFSTPSPGRARILVAGLNQNVIGDGVVANIKFDISSSASTGTVVTLQALSPIASDANGNPIPAEGKNGSLKIGIPGDINNDGAVNVLDVQLCINQALGVAPETASADMNGDGAVNVLDVQLVINKALGL